MTSINSREEDPVYNTLQQNSEEKESSMGWHTANGYAKDHHVNGNTDNIELLLEQLRNAQDDLEVCQYLEMLVRLLSNQKVLIYLKWFHCN